jgi:hypothetical protein
MNINKIAICLPEVRQLDYYKNFVEMLGKENFMFIIDEKNLVEAELSRGCLQEIGYSFLYISDVLTAGLRFRVVLSTGNFRYNLLTGRNIYLGRMREAFMYLYAHTMGRLMDVLGLSNYLIKKFGRPLSGGGKLRRYNSSAPVYIERLLGKMTVLFPRGLDINLSTFPGPEMKGRFDLFLTNSPIVERHLEAKGIKALSIGYPRYAPPSTFDYSVRTRELLGLSPQKYTLLWMPTRSDLGGPCEQNIVDWLPHVKRLTTIFNVVIRPHPHLMQLHSLVSMALNAGLVVDDDPSRKLQDLYGAADAVLVDYGGSVFSSIYLEKPIFFLCPRRLDYSSLGVLFNTAFKGAKKFSLKCPGKLLEELMVCKNDAFELERAKVRSLRETLFPAGLDPALRKVRVALGISE